MSPKTYFSSRLKQETTSIGGVRGQVLTTSDLSQRMCENLTGPLMMIWSWASLGGGGSPHPLDLTGQLYALLAFLFSSCWSPDSLVAILYPPRE